MKAIVTTTIRSPSDGLKKFASILGWKLYVVGDIKTPHEEYNGWNYISPDEQHDRFFDLSNVIGWNTIQRRNIGFVAAYLDGAECIASVDDDVIPYEFWGKNLLIDKEFNGKIYDPNYGVFDPLSVTSVSELWHRGYPIELVHKRFEMNEQVGSSHVLVQADLWDGEPDIDAACRLINLSPSTMITGDFPYMSLGISVFNSQNTFIHRKAFPHYCVLPAGRLDDIWGGIILQQAIGPCVIFQKPSIFHDRNNHNIFDDLRDEINGYEMTMKIITHGEKALPDKCKIFLEQYRKIFS